MTANDRRRYVQIGGEIVTLQPVDNGIHFSLVTTSVPVDVQRVEDGNMFSTSKIFEAVADNGTATVFIDPGTTVLGLEYETSCGGDTFVRFRENVTMSSNGTALTSCNHNRNSANVIDGTVYHTPTYSDGGTIKDEFFIPGGEKNFATGGGGGIDNKYILDVDYDYSIDIVNKSGGASDVSVRILLYED